MIRTLKRLFASASPLADPAPAAVMHARPLVIDARPEEQRRSWARRGKLKIKLDAVGQASHPADLGRLEAFTIPAPAPGAKGRQMIDGQTLLAMDDMGMLTESFGAFQIGGFFKEGLGFLGYPYLAELSQRAEYRRPVEILAKEMTRKGVKLSSSAEGAADKIKELDETAAKFQVMDRIRVALEHDGYFGRGQIFVDTGDTDDAQELTRPLIVDKRKLGKGGLKGFRNVEPIWVYPAAFNATDPLKPDYYKPQLWYVQGQAVHSSRLLKFVSREVPDILKPAYCFGGLALTQMGKPYVDNWLSTRQAVNDLIKSFSVPVLKTDMGALLEGGDASDVFRRVDFFTRTRDNRGALVIDKEQEEFENVSAPLGSLDKLQAQAQEHQSAVFGIPLVVLLGITPSGLNASSDGEIKTFYANIRAQQEDVVRPVLHTILSMLQLHLWGEIDDSIDFEFEPLWEESAKDKADTEKAKADTAAAYINAGVIAPEEERERIMADDSSMYQGVDLSGPPPEPPVDPALEGDPDGEDDPGEGGPPGPKGGAQDEAPKFEESKHPRAENGQFGSGSGGVAAAHKAHAQAQKPIPAEHFNAAAYAQQHDDAAATPESVVSGFEPDTAAKLNATRARVQARGQTIDRHRVSGAGEEGIYTAERQRVQHDVLEKPFTDARGKVHPPILDAATIAAATPAKGERPKFLILGGRGGSGKSKFKNLVYDPDKFLVLDSDEIKQRLPEYEGWNANEVHEESSDILARALTFARLRGLNVVLDGTLKTSGAALERLKQFKEDGYETEAHYMHLPRHEAAKRAIERFLGPTGRFVPPEVVLGNKTNEQSFEDVKPHVDRWSFHDNHNVHKNDAPKLIAQGAKSQAEIDATKRTGRP